jgi:hypothetical protein
MTKNRPHGGSALRLLLCAVCSVAAAACGSSGPEEWDAAAVRAVARHVQQLHSGSQVLVLPTIGASDGASLAWDARQALTTAGLELADSTALQRPGAILLVFETSQRHPADVWTIETRRIPTDDVAATATSSAGEARDRWHVRCDAQTCTVEPAGATPDSR